MILRNLYQNKYLNDSGGCFLYKPTLPPEILKLEGISTISRLKVVNFQKHREKSD